MVTFKLPDNSTKQFDAPACAMQVAEDISPGLARAAVAAEIDGELRDLTAPLPDG